MTTAAPISPLVTTCAVPRLRSWLTASGAETMRIIRPCVASARIEACWPLYSTEPPTVIPPTSTAAAAATAGHRRQAGTTGPIRATAAVGIGAVSYTHLRAHETRHDIVCRL